MFESLDSSKLNLEKIDLYWFEYYSYRSNYLTVDHSHFLYLTDFVQEEESIPFVQALLLEVLNFHFVCRNSNESEQPEYIYYQQLPELHMKILPLSRSIVQKHIVLNNPKYNHFLPQLYV
jgi:hypothetical protein